MYSEVKQEKKLGTHDFISNFQKNLNAAIANIPTFTKRAGGG